MTAPGMLRGPLLNPRSDGAVEYLADALLVGDARGRIAEVGSWAALAPKLGSVAQQARCSAGLIIPPMLDAHCHIPQHPIRGKFLEGVEPDATGGQLLAGLSRNVFPAEGRCVDLGLARRVIDEFRTDTLAHGVVGGAAYMTVHTAATRAALEQLPAEWSVGLVLMNQYCPEYLRTDESQLEADLEGLSRDFGRRVIVTDRFAVAVGTQLRCRSVALADRLGLRMQTHLNEQIAEKNLVETELYPHAESYTDVYRRDGLLDHDAILAHCIRMTEVEFDMLAAAGSTIAHCPVSNALLGSGVMRLDEVMSRRIPYAVCTDIGASPTTSLLCEMAQFLKVHAGRSAAATPSEALFRVTLAPAEILGLADRLGSFERGKEMSFVEVACQPAALQHADANSVILHGLLDMNATELNHFAPHGEMSGPLERLIAEGLVAGDDLHRLTSDVRRTAERLDSKVLGVTLAGQSAWQR